MSKPLSILTAIFALATVGLGVAATVTNHWYYVNTATNSYQGLFKTCSAGTCVDISLTGYTLASCSKSISSSDLKLRVNFTRALIIAGFGLGFFVFVLSIPLIMSFSKSLGVVRVIVAAFSIACYGAGIALYIYDNESWLYCGKKYCTWYAVASPGSACSANYGYSSIIAFVGCGCAAVQLVFASIYMCKAQPDGGSAGGKRELAATEPISGQAGSSKAPADVPAPPEGDWTYDSASGLFWSESHQLFLHTQSSQFYDPKSGMWFNPDTQEWYNPPA